MAHKHQNNIYFKPVLKPVKGSNMCWFFIMHYGHIIYYHKSSLRRMKECHGYWAGEKSALRWSTAHRSFEPNSKMVFRSRVTFDTGYLLRGHAYWELFKMKQ